MSLTKFVLKDLLVKGSKMYIGDFIILSQKFTGKIIKFKDMSNKIEVTNDEYDKLTIDGPFNTCEDDIYEFTNGRLSTSNICSIFYKIMGGSENFKNESQKAKIEKIIDKARTDSYITAGYQRCINISEHNKIKLEIEQSRNANNETQVRNNLFFNSNYRFGPIFNRRNRNCTNVFNQEIERSILRNINSIGKLPCGIKEHEYASLKTSNGILFKLLSQISRLKDIELNENVNINEGFFHILEEYKTHIYPNDFEYIKKFHTFSTYTEDFLIHKPISINDIKDQTYKSKEHSINFDHIIPWKGTCVKNCCYGLTENNRDQSNLSKEQVLILYVLGDGDYNRKKLVEEIIQYDKYLDNIIKSDLPNESKIINIKSYINDQYINCRY